MYKRPHYNELFKRLKEPRKYIQVIAGPRQCGKTTLIQQALDSIDIPSYYTSADAVPNRNNIWIEQQWEMARLKCKQKTGKKGFILVLDEIQKISDWTETIKKLWDEDSRNSIEMKVILLGSSLLLLQQGLNESLGGRFEMIRLTHWSLSEMNEAFGISLEKFIYFGGYPGSVWLIPDEKRWKNYIKDALIETTISRDILMMTKVDKPALLKQLFELGAHYSAHILSYNKMIGQLQDAGNTTTLAHYLRLLSSAGMVTGLSKYAGEKVRQRASSPKFQVLNNALITAQTSRSFNESRSNPELWGWLVESAIGAYLVNACKAIGINVYYWRQGDKEIDFLLEKGDQLVAIEVKSGHRMKGMPGLRLFTDLFKNVKPLLVGGTGLPIEDFLQTDPNDLFN
ncbi:MAG: AAA family ATPase [Actinomycetia bacterium]|nr:AAA family ATPase [Actinomycetes bacterium]